MIWERPTGVFTAKPVNSWANPDIVASKAIVEPSYRTDEAKKKLFGVELAKSHKPFEAGIAVFPEDTNAAMWVSWNWLSDPIVLAARDTYLQNVGLIENLLDKEQLAAKFLQIADEKDHNGQFYILEGKDRIAALKAYAEVRGYIGKVTIENSINNTTNNTLELKLIPPPEKDNVKVVELPKNEFNEVTDALPVSLKLVG